MNLIDPRTDMGKDHNGLTVVDIVDKPRLIPQVFVEFLSGSCYGYNGILNKSQI